MAYERDGRKTGLPVTVRKPPGQSQATADLPPRIQYTEAADASPGARSVVGRPVSVFDTVPAGGKKFVKQVIVDIPPGTIPSDAPVYFPDIPVPVGFVMVITGWQVVLVPYDVGSATDKPLYAARVLNTQPLSANLTKNKMVDAGCAAVQFATFDRKKSCHLVAYNADKVSANFFIFADYPWPDFPQRAVLEIDGVLLVPNLQAPEYTELEIGKVKVDAR